MNRTREQWAKVDPRFCVEQCSEAALFHLLKDAQSDIEQLHKQLDQATQPAAGEPEQQTAINADDLPTKKYPLGAFDFDAPVAAGEPVRVVAEPGEELSPSDLVGNRIDRMLTIGTRLYTALPAAAHGDEAVRLYNAGYNAGHHDTVEGGFIEVHQSDMGSYHAEEVEGLLREISAMRAQAGEGGE